MRSALVAVASLVLLATGCSDDDAPPPSDLPTDAPALWNPCDGLVVAEVSELFDTTFATRTGTADTPQCSFTPQTEGDPAVDINYSLYVGTLDELIESFGTPGALTRINGPDLAAADGTAIVVDVQDGTLAVTGFVQNGDLVQVVNALDPAPFDRGLVRRGVRAVLGDLAVHADASGLSGD